MSTPLINDTTPPENPFSENQSNETDKYEQQQNTSTSFDFNISTLPFTTITNFVTSKLDDSNYLIWKNQMESILICTDLFGFIDGSITPPSPSILVGFTEVLNPEYLKWRKWDRFVMSCLNATFTPSVSSAIIGLSTSKQVWLSLAKNFSDQFVARKNLSRNQLHSIKRSSSSMSDYLLRLKEIADSLAAINEHVS